MGTPLEYSQLPPQTRRRHFAGTLAAVVSLAAAVVTTLWCLRIWSTYLYYNAAYHSVREVVAPLLSLVPALAGVAVAGWLVARRTRTWGFAAAAGALLALFAWAWALTAVLIL